MKQFTPKLLVACLAAVAMLVSAGLSTPLHAQTFFGSIVGTVTDNTGAVVPNATVTITDLATNEVRTDKTNAAGEYSFVSLVPATYKVDVQMSSFKRFERNPVEVAVNTATRVDAKLQVGAATETVEVTTNAPLLQTESGSLGDEVGSKQVEDMPLNGRNTMNLMELVPGVVPEGGTNTGVAMNGGGSTSSVGWGNYQIGGGMPTQSSILIDGSPTMLMQKNTSALVPTADTVQEFQVETSGVSPEFGRFGGGIVSMTTKSGSNAFHGTAYEYVRNKDVNANLFFSKRDGIARGEYTQNQFGGTVGGPIWKNKAFFFVAYEQDHIRQQSAPDATNVPTAGMVNGTKIPDIWAATSTNQIPAAQSWNGILQPACTIGQNGATLCLQNTNVYDPLGHCNITHTAGAAPSSAGPGSGYWTIPFGQGNCVEDTTAALFATFYPTTPKNQVSNLYNFNTVYSQGDDGYQLNGRVDYDLTHNQRIFARFTLWPLADESPNVVGVVNPKYNTIGDGSHNHTNNIVTGDTITLSPTTILDIRADYLRQYGDSVPPAIGGVTESAFGTPFAAIAPTENYHNIPGFTVTGYHSLFNFGYSGVDKMWYNNYHLGGGVTKIFGKHAIKFGAEVRLMERDDLGTANSGTASFGDTIDTPNALYGDEWAAFLLGEFTSSSVSSAKATTMYNWYTAYYAADTWQVSQKLTMSYGLRLETPGSYAENKNNVYVLLPNAVDPVTEVPGTLGLVASNLYIPRYTLDEVPVQWGPRFGVAYRLTSSTVLRGGYSLSYLPRDTQTGEFGTNESINSQTSGNTNNAVAGAVPSYTLDSNAFAYPNNQTPPSTTEGMALAAGRNQSTTSTSYFTYSDMVNGTALSGPNPQEPAPYTQEMNVSVGHTMKGDTLIDLGLAHTLATHLPRISEGLDQLPDQYDVCGAATSATTPGCLSQPLGGALPTTSYATQTTALGTVTLPKSIQLYGQSLRPYPQYSNFSNTADYHGTSSYDALELKVQKRFHATGQIGGAYTWMKMITDTDSFLASSQNAGGEAVYQDYTNPKGERALYGSDVPNRLSVNYILNLPVGRGQRFLAGGNGVVSRVISGWSASGITTFQTGLPMHLTSAANKLSSNFGAGTIRPYYAPGCTKTVGGSGLARTLVGATWFNTSCFQEPGTPTSAGGPSVGGGSASSFGFGNEPRTDDAIKVSGVDNTDFSIDKTTAIHDQLALRLTVQFFNVFNRTQFSPPATAAGSGTFGVVTAQQNLPRVAQGALRFTF